MTALANARRRALKSIKTIRRVLADEAVAFEGGIACIDLGVGELVPAKVDTTIFPVGTFADVGNGVTGDGTVTVKVNLFKEIWCEWFANAAGGDAVDAGDVGGLCYLLDDQTVTANATGKSVAGRVWDVSATKGVLVEFAMSMGPTGPAGA